MGKVFFVAFLCVSAASAQQEADRTFRIKNASPTGLLEIATSLRVVAGVNKLAVDQKGFTITIKGPSDLLALADWIVPKLDIANHSGLGFQEYHLHNLKDEAVMIAELEHVTNTTSLQEVITSLRTLGDTQFVYNVTEPKIILLRGDPGQIAFAGFLFHELDQIPQQRSEATIHSFIGSPKDSAVVYGLVHATDVSSMQRLITNLRSIIGISRVYQETAPALLTLRGTNAELQISEWLLSELDRAAPNTGVNEMRMPGGNDDVLHVFYLSHISDSKAVNTLVGELRNTIQSKKIYFMNQPVAIVVRGTADQVALAGKLIALKDQPKI